VLKFDTTARKSSGPFHGQTYLHRQSLHHVHNSHARGTVEKYYSYFFMCTNIRKLLFPYRTEEVPP